MATYFWVGGNGTWDNSSTANWSNVSGGSAGFGPPTSADTVKFDSGSGTGTCTTASTAAALLVSLDSTTITLSLGANLTISSSFTLNQGTLDLTGNSGNWTLTCLLFQSSNNTTRAIKFGTGNITLTGNNTTIWQVNYLTGFSYTGTPTVNATYSGGVGTRRITHGYIITPGGDETNAVSFNITAGTDATTFAIDGGNHVKNLNFTGYSGTFTIGFNNYIYGDLTFSSGMSVAGTRPIVFSLSSGTQQITSNGKTLGSAITKNGNGTFQLQDNFTISSYQTFTLTAGTLNLNNQTLSTGIFSSTNTNTRSILFGTGNITLTGNGGIIWNMSIADNFTYTGTSKINATYSGAIGTRTFAFGGTSGGTETNALNLYVTAGTDTISCNTIRTLDFTGFSGSFTSNTRSIYGNLIISSGMTVIAGTSVTTFAGTSGTQQITTNGKTIDFPLTFNGVGGTFEFQDALTQGSTRATTLTNGTLKFKSGTTNVVGSFVTSGTTQKYLQSTSAGSQATLSQASGTVNVSYTTIKDINATGGATFNAYRSLNNIDAGNNTGWDFLSTPVTTSTLSLRLGFGL